MGEGKCREKCARSANPSHDIPVGVGGLGYVRLCRCRRRWRKWDFGLILFAFKLRGQTLRMPSLSALLLRLLTMHYVPRYFSSRWFWQNALSLAMKEKIIRCSIDSTNNVASSLNASMRIRIHLARVKYTKANCSTHYRYETHYVPSRKRKKRNKITGKSLSREEGCSSKCAKPPSKIKNLVTEVAERSTFFSTRSKLRWKKGEKRRKKKEKYQGKIAQLTHRWERATPH